MRETKNAIVTRADNSVKEMTDFTHPIIKQYAHECGADFIQLDHDMDFMTDDGHPHYRILKVQKLLDDYERILVLDSDIVINKKRPDLFKMVPRKMIGSIYEDKGTRKPNRRMKIKAIQDKYGDVGWVQGYINTGVFMVHRIHQPIFEPINDEYYTGDGSDDLHFGYNIHKHGFHIRQLPFTCNHMTMFSEPWNNSADRFKSYFIHYAGAGRFNPALSRLDNIKHDMEKIYGPIH